MSKIPEEYKLNLINVDVDLRTILGNAACDVNMCDVPLSEQEKTELVECLQAASEIIIHGLRRKAIERKERD